MTTLAHFLPGKPVRKVVTRGSSRVTGRFASRKMGTMVPWESFIERDFIRLAEVDPTDIGIHAQPIRVEYRIRGQAHSYVPDFLVQFGHGSNEIHEVKDAGGAPSAKGLSGRGGGFCLDEEMGEHLRAAGRVITELGYRYHPTLDTAIRKVPRFSSAKTLERSTRHDVRAEERLFVQAILDEHPGIPVAALYDGRVGRVIQPAAIHRLAMDGDLSFDIDSPLSPSSALWRVRPDMAGQRWLPENVLDLGENRRTP